MKYLGQIEGGQDHVNKDYVDDALDLKQDTLTSGTNIKTINSTSILGSGHIPALSGVFDGSTHRVDLSQKGVVGSETMEFYKTSDGLTMSAHNNAGNVYHAELVDKTYVSRYQTQAQVEALILDELSRFDKLDYEIVATLPATGTAGVRYLVKHPTDDRYEEYIYVNGAWYDIGATDEVNLDDYYTKTETDLLLDDKADVADIPTSTSQLTNDGDGTNAFITSGDAATDSAYGVVKTNSARNITLNASGQLEVGGRLGQTVDLGLYNPTFADPAYVGRFSLLMSEGLHLSVAHRSMVIAGGSNVTLKTTAAAGATEYRISNTQTNRFLCSCFRGGVIAVDEASAKEKTVPITSVKYANGNDCVPYFGANENNNDIIVTTSESLNPDSTLKSIRGYGTWNNADDVSIGQGNRADGSKALQIGQGCQVDTSKNQTALIGIRLYTAQGSCILVGADILNKKLGAALFGKGHDTTNAPNYVGLFGQWSDCQATTLFAVGNGTAYNARSNAFEVTTDGGIVLKSPNGTRYKITVADDGTLSTTAVT